MKDKLNKWIFHPLQALLAYCFYGIFRILPINVSAKISAFLFRNIGPRLKAHKVAKDNLRKAFPEWDEAKINQTVREVWDNLGRSTGEYMRLDDFSPFGDNPRVIVENEHYLKDAIENGGRFILFSAHMANWEIGPLTAAKYGAEVANIYRHAANPYIDKLIRHIRRNFSGVLIPKGREGAKQLVKELRKGTPLGFLVDQKLNEGMAIPFFGRDCMTATTPAELALRYNCPMIPAQIIRLPNSHFKLIFQAPLELKKTDDPTHDVQALLIEMNQIIEGWVRENPGQWFWVHRRWPKE